jgi:hypothetical protein
MLINAIWVIWRKSEVWKKTWYVKTEITLKWYLKAISRENNIIVLAKVWKDYVFTLHNKNADVVSWDKLEIRWEKYSVKAVTKWRSVLTVYKLILVKDD